MGFVCRLSDICINSYAAPSHRTHLNKAPGGHRSGVATDGSSLRDSGVNPRAPSAEALGYIDDVPTALWRGAQATVSAA
jgi:hypothetical protein